MTRPVAFVAGLLFALGLVVSGMTQPSKVIGFLDVFGAWDPSLALVMVGAIAVHLTWLRATRRWSKPVCAPAFQGPSQRSIDARLVTGAATFGVGWGLAGYCPGPALTSLFAGQDVVVLTLAMLVGMLGYELQQRATSRPQPDPMPEPQVEGG